MADIINTGDQHTTAQLATITPELGDVLYDKTKHTLVVGDSETKGGNPMAKEDDLCLSENENDTLIYCRSNNWDDIRVPVFSTNKGGTKDPDFVKVLDDGVASQGVFTYAFDKLTEEELYFAVQLPHGWKLESDIEPHVHWMPKTSGPGSVSWGLEYSIAKIGTVFPGTTIIYGNETHVVESLVENKHYLTDLGFIDMTGVDLVSAMIMCRVFRDATGAGETDDYDDDANLLEIDFHYQIDSVGSGTEYIK